MLKKDNDMRKPIKDSLPLMGAVARVMTRNHHLMCLVLDEHGNPLLLCKTVEIVKVAGRNALVNLYGVVENWEKRDPVAFEFKRDSVYVMAENWLEKEKICRRKKGKKTIKR